MLSASRGTYETRSSMVIREYHVSSAPAAGVLPHPDAIRAHGVQQRAVAECSRPAERPPGDDEARGEPLHVPLERAGEGLVEVVEVEHERPLWRAVDAELGQVRVTAQLDPQVGPGRRAQVGGHHSGRPAIERERRDGHPAVADRQQHLDPARPLGLEDRDRVRPVRARARHWPWSASGASARAASPALRLSSRDARSAMVPGAAVAVIARPSSALSE